jgi:hypothetical protein
MLAAHFMRLSFDSNLYNFSDNCPQLMYDDSNSDKTNDHKRNLIESLSRTFRILKYFTVVSHSQYTAGIKYLKMKIFILL